MAKVSRRQILRFVPAVVLALTTGAFAWSRRRRQTWVLSDKDI